MTAESAARAAPQLTYLPPTTREFMPGVVWFTNCVAARSGETTVHASNATYLVLGSEKTLLVDTALPNQWPGLEPALADALADRTLNYAFPTHPELPHSGNIRNLWRKYPGLVAVGDVRDYDFLFDEPGARWLHKDHGDTLDLGARQLTFIRAPVYDLQTTMWAYDDVSQTLFVSDALAFGHMAPEMGDDPIHPQGVCGLLTSELPAVPGPQGFLPIIKSAFQWTQYVDMVPIWLRLRSLLEEYPTRFIAPAHGSVITEPVQMLDVMLEAYKQVFPASFARR